MWAAYLVRHEGFPIADAYARGSAIGIDKSPPAQLPGIELELVEKP